MLQAAREKAQTNRQQSTDHQGTQEAALFGLIVAVAQTVFKQSTENKQNHANGRRPKRTFTAEKTVVDGA